MFTVFFIVVLVFITLGYQGEEVAGCSDRMKYEKDSGHIVM